MLIHNSLELREGTASTPPPPLEAESSDPRWHQWQQRRWERAGLSQSSGELAFLA